MFVLRFHLQVNRYINTAKNFREKLSELSVNSIFDFINKANPTILEM